MKPTVHGIHHVTVISGDAQENLDFYTKVMGMRLVKKSINQDAPDTYHLFYADAEGTPGTDLTFFPWAGLPRARPGVGQVVEVPLAVPVGSMTFWRDRLAEHGVETRDDEVRFEEHYVPFEDPHGLKLALVEVNGKRRFAPWNGSPVPAEHQVRGVHTACLWESSLGPTEALLTEVMGFEKVAEEGEWHRYGVSGSTSGALVDVRVLPDGPRGGRGAGGVHHVAWRVHDEDEERAVRHAVESAGLRPTPLIDRFWFKSVYFHEPGGVLFELATDGPGFARDEDAAHLGEVLILPPWMEEQRAQIEAGLPPLTH
ncbi:MAG: ring-cleaving dioxygenase [Bacteroidota bacterium]